MKILKRLLCKHESKRLVRQIFGDEINHRNGARSEWECTSCGKRFVSRYLSMCVK